MLSWGGVIRSTNGVYQSRFDLRHLHPQPFAFTADSPPDQYTNVALQLPEVKTYWGFARFPVIRSASEEGLHIVEFGENRFVNPKRRRRQPSPTSSYLIPVVKWWRKAGNRTECSWKI